MIVPDVNMLVYSYDEAAPEHKAARLWWEGLLDGTETVGMPWVVTTGFVRVITNPRSARLPLSPVAAADCVQDWLSRAHITAINPGPNHLSLFRSNLAASHRGANLVPDAHIAALAVEYDAEVHSADRDFGRFPGVRWHNPLQ